MIIFVSLSRLVRFPFEQKTPWRTMVLLCWSSEALGLKMFPSFSCWLKYLPWGVHSSSHTQCDATLLFVVVQPSGYGKQTWLRMRILLWKTSWALTRLWNPTVLSEFSGVFWFLSCLDSSVLLNISWGEGRRNKDVHLFSFSSNSRLWICTQHLFLFFFIDTFVF